MAFTSKEIQEMFAEETTPTDSQEHMGTVEDLATQPTRRVVRPGGPKWKHCALAECEEPLPWNSKAYCSVECLRKGNIRGGMLRLKRKRDMKKYNKRMERRIKRGERR